MFNKDLFYSLCAKYNVEMSDCYDKPMIKDGDIIRPLTDEDVKRIFVHCQSYFDYASSMTNTKTCTMTYSMMDEFATAC